MLRPSVTAAQAAKGGGKAPANGKGGNSAGVAQGKGKQAPKAQAKPQAPEKSLQALEAEFAAKTNEVYDALLNLNVSMADLGGMWNSTLALRSKILKMYGVPAYEAAVPAPAAKKSAPANTAAAVPPQMQAFVSMMQQQMGWGAGGLAAGAAAADTSGDYKSKLNTAVAKRAKASIGKGEIVYTVVEDPSGGGFWATVSGAAHLAQEYHSAEAASSKKLAEHAAARSALEAEFPEVLMGEAQLWTAPAAQGKKRKAAEAYAPSAPLEDPKSKLMQTVQILAGRSLTKTDIVYEVAEVDAAGTTRYQATVVLPAHDPSTVHQGAEAESKKQAEHNAAMVANAALAPLAAPLEEERRAKKARMAQEKAAEWKKQREAKRAAAVGAA